MSIASEVSNTRAMDIGVDPGRGRAASVSTVEPFSVSVASVASPDDPVQMKRRFDVGRLDRVDLAQDELRRRLGTDDRRGGHGDQQAGRGEKGCRHEDDRAP